MQNLPFASAKLNDWWMMGVQARQSISFETTLLATDVVGVADPPGESPRLGLAAIMGICKALITQDDERRAGSPTAILDHA